MKAKRSAILLFGLLVLMIIAAWAQTSDTKPPTCPPLEDAFLQSILEKDKTWVRTAWNANTKVWDIRCNEMEGQGNLPMYAPGGPKSNVNAPARKRKPHEE